MAAIAQLARRLQPAWPVVWLGVLLLLLLAVFVRVDPPAGVTVSTSPYTDEGWMVVNARNFIQLGAWSTDDWNLHLVNGPFSLLEAAMFWGVGVGIVPARMIPILSTVAMVLLMGLGLARPLGRTPAFVAAVALGSSALVLYYGRLAYLEPVVALLLVAGFLTLDAGEPRRAAWLGLFGGGAFALAAGTKPLALLSVAGIVAGVLMVALRSRPARWWSAGVMVAMGIGLAGWLALVALPRLGEIQVDLAIWAREPLPSSLRMLATWVRRYVSQSDGAITLALPLLIGGASGLAICMANWRRLTPVQRRMAAAAAGWALVAIGGLLVVNYRPNRYVVPALPALAILCGLGAAAIGPLVAGWRAALRRLAGAALVAALVVPGIVLDVRWLTATPTTLPGIQAQVAAALPPGSILQGAEAATLGMTSRAVLLVSRPADGVNPGDWYVRGARWVVGRPNEPADVPDWAALHPSAWAARREVLCFPWAGDRFCIWRLP